MYVVTYVLLLRYDVGVLFWKEIRQYWWENNAKFFAVQPITAAMPSQCMLIN